MLIRNAWINFTDVMDVRIGHGRISAIGRNLAATETDEPGIDAAGAALLPGLTDHHLHVCSLAASLASVPCGPPQVANAEELAQRLCEAAQVEGSDADDWIRGIGYHESVAGEIDRAWLDRHVPARPVRIQHRSGRLWILNSAALERLAAGPADSQGNPLERINGQLTGRLYDADAWLRSRMGGKRPALRQVSRQLARFGVTTLTDTTPRNGPDEFTHFADARARGELLQDIVVMGDARLDAAFQKMSGLKMSEAGDVRYGARKFHLHENELPDFEVVCAEIRRSHESGRPVAFHCVTRSELVLALGALREAGAIQGDRIEHAAVTPPEFMPFIANLGLVVVTQPNFIAERGDVYLSEVETDDRPWLYRLRGFLDAGIPLAGSTDAPFGDANPWKAMQAAVDRKTANGHLISPTESLKPEEALSLFTTAAEAPGRMARQIEVGAKADLCLLSTPWSQARLDLAGVSVRATLKAGHMIWAE